MPGGCTVGDKVFYTDSSDTFDDGNKVVHGQQGEVTGPVTLEGYQGKAVNVFFSSTKVSVSCFLDEVSRLHAAPRRCHPPGLRPTHTRSCAHTPRALPRQPMCRGAPALTA